MPSPVLPLNCLKCGTRLVYRHSQGDTHFYRCPKHGVVVLPPSGIIRVDDPDNSAVRH